MKKMIFLFLFCAINCFAYANTRLRTGTYFMSGANSKWSATGYQGEVVIQQQGENYRVTWYVGSSQSQVGIGILNDNILSVSFCDTNNRTFWGVASYRIVGDGELEGRWTSVDGTGQKPEYLAWQHY